MTDDHNRLIEPEHDSDKKPENTPTEPIRWVTKGQRVAAWIAAIAVIVITCAYIYSIYTGALFSQ